MTDRWSCAREARSRGEPMFATASVVPRWIMVEQPGPWGSDAILESRLPGATARGLRALGHELRARVILIRRYGREDPDEEGHTVFVGSTAAGDTWLETFEVERPADVLDLELGALRRGGRPGGRPVDQPVYLVCTNGRHDACCAEFGRPVAAALTASRPDRTWECSHIGGDRFAGNLLCFPHGLYYGHVEPDRALEVAKRYEDGELDLEVYRGRSCYPFHVQAAEHFVRTEHDLTAVEGLRLVDRDVHDPGRVVAAFEAPDGARYTAEVAIAPDPEGRLLTCKAERAACPPRYELVRLERADPSA